MATPPVPPPGATPLPPPLPPPPPQKPIRSTKWGLILAFAVVGFLVLVNLATSIHLSKPAPKRNANRPVGAAVVQSFDAETKQMTEDLQHQKETLQAAIDKVHGVDLSRLLKPVPECNQATRDQLNGRYFVSATSDGLPVRLTCEANNQWAVIPDAAASIQPLTDQQEIAMRQAASGQQQGSSGQSAAEQRRQERERKREEALNSSSVALDFTKKPERESASEAELVKAAETHVTPEREDDETGTRQYGWDHFTGPAYRVFEGTVIETVLTNRLNGEFTGPVNVMVTTDLYSHDHQHILMPQGTRVLGEAAKVSVQQQRRLGVVFHRAIMPDGYSVDFDKFAALDQQGASGLTGRVNTHWAKVIGTAILVGAIGGLSESVGGFGTGYSPRSALETGIGAQTGQQATQILDRALNVLPTVTVYEGTRVRIWVEKDAELPAYENHRVSPNL